MDLRKIKKLIEMLQESDLNEIEVKEGEESVRINRKKGDVEIVTVDQLNTKPTETFRKRWTHPWCCTEDGTIEYNIL